MAGEPPPSASPGDRPYRLYRGGGSSRTGAPGRGSGPPASGETPPYRTYRTRPRGLRARLRGADQAAGLAGAGRPDLGARPGRRGDPRRGITPLRVLRYVAAAVVAWLLLSLVLFLISSSSQSDPIPASAQAALTPAGNMLTSTDTVLVIGTDQRPKGSKEPGAFGGGIRSDTIMLWRIGGGVSRRLSIPRDTVVPIPGYGLSKINAAYAYGGPALAIKTIEQFTGVSINHLVIVNLAAFPQFVDAIGGVDVTTGRICSDISGGARNGGFSLYLRPGAHHLAGRDALTLARTRENKCNPGSNDLTREGYQQQILNAIKSKLTSPMTFLRLPWASWAAPATVRTDMGGFTLLSLFAAAELGGSAPTRILADHHLPLPDAQSPAGRAAVRRAVARLMNG